MVKTFQSQVSFMSLFRGIKSAFADSLSVCHYLHAPFALMRGYAKKTNFICFGWQPHILQIPKPRNFTQVIKTVVLFISVYMIYMTEGPFSRNIKPRKSMRQAFFIVYGNSPISRVCRTASFLSYKIVSMFMRFPDKDARCGVIVKNRSYMVSRNHELAFTIGAGQ
jgi:hypothetical protein